MYKINYLILILTFLCLINTSSQQDVSSNAKCGPDVNNKCGSTCCSKWGYCGTTTDHCGDGCQEGYGVCGLAVNNNTNIGEDGIQVITTCQNPNILALTFDDGPRSWTNELLDKLDEYGIKATFFINGHNQYDSCIYDYADIIQRAYYSGHLIAHHTWSHPYLTGCSADEVNYQITFLNEAFKKIIGCTPKYFRPPYGNGVNNTNVRSAMKANGMDKMVIWDVDVQDSISGITEQQCEENFSKAISDQQPHIVLNHDRIQSTCEQLAPFEISKAMDSGYWFDTVAGCIGDYDSSNWYNCDTDSFGTRDDTWTCNEADMHNSFNTTPQ
ncbi:20961_t:CDS:2 [Racocetra persica]|uniref:20961_t:CDS:1 n=1 Tax=Racocetra persica TaxID=160502 RepID=A0ACA9KTZ0_9GLOM|nr:20961_t:CDS:2 [Racocetra persica]